MKMKSLKGVQFLMVFIFICLEFTSYGQTKKGIKLVFPNGGEVWEVNKQPEVKWECENISYVGIQYSTDNGNSWNSIANAALGVANRYTWNVPSTVSDECFIRVFDASDSTIADTSNYVFKIIEANQESYRIVILGSSTAAGNGPSVRDSAWVWRYQEYLSERDTRFDVINLARGGYTTYNLLPTGTVITGVNENVDTERNITKALSYNPDAVIINLPSNDARRNYPVSEQLANYRLITESAVIGGASLWVTTPQPRNDLSKSETQIQFDLLDSTFSVFGDFVVDFWDGFSEKDGKLDSQYDSGDGIHMNDLGHRILFEKVVGKDIPSFVLSHSYSTGSRDLGRKSRDDFSIYPNPANSFLIVKFDSDTKYREVPVVRIFSPSGKMIRQQVITDNQSELEMDISSLKAGTWILQVEGKECYKSKYFVKK